MSSRIAVLTYRRLHALAQTAAGLREHCSAYPTAVFEDCGQQDGTSRALTENRRGTPDPRLRATRYMPVDLPSTAWPEAEIYMGDLNLGVAGNSNRALRWFMDSDADHLCLCNDDLLVKGDFVEFYARAHRDLGVEMFCFCDFTQQSPAISGPIETYKWTTYPVRGYKVKLLPRFTGIMLSVTRSLIEKIGYFDAEFGKFGEEHSDFTVRARMAGGIRLSGADMHCLDVEHSLLGHQDVNSSVSGSARKRADREASLIMQRCAHEYRYRHYHRPFRLSYPVMADGQGDMGLPCRQLEQIGYHLVQAA